MSNTEIYLKAVTEIYESGKATEHSYRSCFQQYLELIIPDVTATNEPKRQKCGAPDYIVTKNSTKIDIGYIETKDIGKNLDEIENDAQLKRYKESLDNLILTDYLDFRFFKENVKIAQVKIAKLENGKIIFLPENNEILENLLKEFADFQGQTINSASILASMLARKATLMQEVFYKAIITEEKNVGLKGQLQAFRQILINDMEEEEFSDVYAQTITYGLFTARLHTDNSTIFSRNIALELIPLSNPFLRKLFQYVALELEDNVAWIVDALCDVLRATNMHDIMADFGKQSGRDDPIVHFYETFLSEYSPHLRKSRGVWYTPEPVVNFIIRAVDDVLKNYFNLSMGIADTSKVIVKNEIIDNSLKKGVRIVEKEVHKVHLLDVATGTGTFISEVIRQIYNNHFVSQKGLWSNYVEEHILPRLHGFEILMASYAMCHLKIDLLLQETGYKPKDIKKQPRLGVYLTNSLEEAHPDKETLFASWLSAEANAASQIKRDMPVMVAMGNPPYNVSTQNKGKWIGELIEVYKKGLNERNINPLSDDYIKFIRHAEHYIERTGYGIVAMITNNSFLDGIIHRQMRKHLLETFDAIYIYDLHGSAKKKETAPDGSIDQNVFEIQQGVAISIFIKYNPNNKELAEVYHADLYGKRASKYATLWQNDLKNTGFKKLTYSEPYYFFVPKDFDGQKKYEKGFKLNKLFIKFASGIKFRKDNLLVSKHFSKSSVLEMINDMNKLTNYEILNKYEFSETKDWKILEQKQFFVNYSNQDIMKVNYRPFDTRYTYYPIDKINKIIPRGDSRQELMRNFINRNNIGLILRRTGEN
ncbi:MAG: N-6 DNA methylase, partial [Pseudomonadota bacterium]